MRFIKKIGFTVNGAFYDTYVGHPGKSVAEMFPLFDPEHHVLKTRGGLIAHRCYPDLTAGSAGFT